MPTLSRHLIINCLSGVLLITLFMPVIAIAEAKFITDKIFVDAYEQATGTGKLAFSVLSGTPIEVVKVEGEYSSIKNREGKTGWVHNKYISNEKPSQILYLQIRKKYDNNLVKIRELQSKKQMSKDQSKSLSALNKVKKSLAVVEKEKLELEKSLSERTDSLNKSIGAINVLTEQLGSMKDSGMVIDNGDNKKATPPPKEFTLPIVWTIAALVLCLAIGITIGIKWLEHKINKRHGGVKIF